MKVSKTFSLESKDLIRFERWMESQKIRNQSVAFRQLLQTAGIIDNKETEKKK